MSAFHDNALLGASGQQGYKISRSVRLRSSASAYFNRTPASAGNRRTWTWSGWVKRGTLSTRNIITQAEAGGNTNAVIEFNSDQLRFFQQVGGSDTFYITSTQVFRDPSAWYHIVVVLDTTQATNTNRMKMYVNGVQITSFASSLYPSQNFDGSFNNNVAQYIGTWLNVPAYFDGYMTEINFIDGQALTPSSFGETDTATGVWKPKKYTGTYGTNGFYLNFSDNSGATATTIGKDYSGNGNNWTPNNISVTAGVTYDSMVDVPTLYADGGNGRGNYCTISPFQMAVSGAIFTLSSGNLNYSCSASAGNAGRMTTTGSMALPTGKTYWEIKVTNTNPYIGIGERSQIADNGSGSRKSINVYNAGQSADNTTATYTGTTFSFTTNDMIGFAFDGTAMTLGCYKNGSLIGTFSAIDSTVTWLPSFGINASASSTSMEANFGQRPFSYTPPTGFVALNTQNLPTPTISNGANYMAATLYTGNGSTQTVNNSVGFYPDLNWIKSRSNAGSNVLVNSVVGGTKQLFSNLTDAEQTNTNITNGISSSGIALGNNSSGTGSTNQNTYTYVLWQWLANAGSTVSNTSGSITSTVSAGATQGFSVVTYTGNGTNPGATVGHGLGVAPKLIITKSRSGTGEWPSYHASVGVTNTLYLNATYASSTYLNRFSAVSSTTFTTGSNGIELNANGVTYVAYCFAEVAGYSKFGSYTGNGSTDGPFVYLGFRPRFVLLKVSSTTGDWVIYDTSRNTYNVVDLYLYPNSSAAQGGSGTPRLDILSNGFKLRNTGQDNTSSATYIYAAFAENPFNISLAR